MAGLQYHVLGHSFLKKPPVFLIALAVKKKNIYILLVLQRPKPSERGFFLALEDAPRALVFPSPLSLSFPRAYGLCLDYALFFFSKLIPAPPFNFIPRLTSQGKHDFHD